MLLVVSLAAFVIERHRRGSRPAPDRSACWRSAWCRPALVFLQPDLGTGVVLVVITLTILFLAGVPWRHFAAMGAVAAAAVTFALVVAPAAGVPLLRGYQQERLTSFLNPSDDPERLELPDQPEQDRHRLRRKDRPWRSSDSDRARVPPRAAHGLHLRRDRGALRIPGGRVRPVPLRPASCGGRCALRRSPRTCTGP